LGVGAFPRNQARHLSRLRHARVTPAWGDLVTVRAAVARLAANRDESAGEIDAQARLEEPLQ
jgi:hypothetical protein